MTRAESHRWECKARFRRHAYGWRASRLAVGRAVAAEGAIELLERLSPALEDAAEGFKPSEPQSVRCRLTC